MTLGRWRKPLISSLNPNFNRKVNNNMSRVQQINAAIRQEQAKQHKRLVAVFYGALAAVCLTGGIAGFASAPHASKARYNLIESVGEESSVADYGLTYDDCAAVLEFERSKGKRMSCETATN